MIWALAAAVIGAASLGGMIYATRRARRRHAPALVAADLADRVTAAAAAFATAEPWSPSAAAGPDAPAAAAVEAQLIAGDPKRALEAAEAAVAAAPDAAAPRAWLAWALVANAQPRAALRMLETGPAATGPLARYVHARAEHLLFEHGTGAIGALPPLITTADLAIVTLARGKGSATWLAGATDVQLSAAQVRAAMSEHRDVTARCLAEALDALAAAPGFADAAYLVARLAVKAGALAPARQLFDAIGPRIAGRPDAEAFARDLADLADPSRAVEAAKQAPAPPTTAKRSTRLKVLP